ncbi:hypothetical protein CEXT_595421 [Caerostris extrusa]|uniref:Uncharacterized protein n=1 Tax=Caerostris extrusa TaxID=172846 RepID=A0AAV4Y2A3_CAEEX|nr:hypothetical protein CEXT_595421 [Caerostris extrusa]
MMFLGFPGAVLPECQEVVSDGATSPAKAEGSSAEHRQDTIVIEEAALSRNCLVDSLLSTLRTADGTPNTSLFYQFSSTKNPVWRFRNPHSATEPPTTLLLRTWTEPTAWNIYMETSSLCT